MKDRFNYGDIIIVADYLVDPDCGIEHLDVSSNY
jgi:hypothetical protein